MSFTRKIKKGGAGLGRGRSPLPRDYVCIDPAQAGLVFDFFKGSAKEHRETVLIHLRLCLHCREAVGTLRKLDGRLEARPEEPFHAAQTEDMTHEVGGATGADDEVYSR